MSSTLIVNSSSAWMVQSRFSDYVIGNIIAHLQHLEFADWMRSAQESNDPNVLDMSRISHEYFDDATKALEKIFQLEIDRLTILAEPVERDRHITRLYLLNQLRTLFMLDQRFRHATPPYMLPKIIVNYQSNWHVTSVVHQFISYSILFGIQDIDLFSRIRTTLNDNLDVNLSPLSQDNYCDFFSSARKFCDHSIQRSGVVINHLDFVDQWVTEIQNLFDKLKLDERNSFC